MIRPVTLLTLVAAMGAGLHLYQTKHAVALLDRELRGIGREITAAQERTVALAAEWAWLNEPERLRAVAQRHLQLEPMQPAQFVRIAEAERRVAEAERRLPPVIAAPVEPLVAVLAVVGAPAAVGGPTGGDAAGTARAEEPPPRETRPPRVEPALAAIAGPRPEPFAGSPARAEPVAATRPAPRVAAAPPRPMAQSVSLRPSGLLPAAASAATPPTASALGGAGSLPPPVPFAR